VKAQRTKFRTYYIDGFSGPGEHRRKATKERIRGTPLEVLGVTPKFDEYHFIDRDGDKVQHLQEQIGQRDDVVTYQGDTNWILPQKVFPLVRYDQYRRGLCLLDPYGLTLDWSVIETAGKSNAIEIFLNFPVADMQRNVFWHNFKGVDRADIERMTQFWGDESWRAVAYKQERDLFEVRKVRAEISAVVTAFRKRLADVAGFRFVPQPIPMRNHQGAIVYYLFFAGPNEAGSNIASALFKPRRL
jgi:three-Cys-motif partner protein